MVHSPLGDCDPRKPRLEKVGPFVPTKVAPIFGSRYVAKLARSIAACGEMGTPQPHQVCAWLLAIFRKIDGNVACVGISTVF